jgi:hypothetical protein
MSTQYTSPPGPINDTNPDVMALAVDNSTGRTIDWQPGPGVQMSPLVVFYVLSSEPTPANRKIHLIWVPENTALGVFAYDEYIGAGSPWTVDFSGGVPVDLEVMYSSGPNNQVDHTFNYLAALVDTGTSWSVMVYRYDPIWPRLDQVSQYNAAFTANPTGLDVDANANEIHVLHETGGAYNVTVLQFTP